MINLFFVIESFWLQQIFGKFWINFKLSFFLIYILEKLDLLFDKASCFRVSKMCLEFEVLALSFSIFKLTFKLNFVCPYLYILLLIVHLNFSSHAWIFSPISPWKRSLKPFFVWLVLIGATTLILHSILLLNYLLT